MFMKRKTLSLLLGGLGAGFVGLAGQGCSSGQRADLCESVVSTKAAVIVAPPGVLAGNSNYWITAADPSGSTGLPITGFNVSIAVREDLHIPNGVSIQLNGWSAPDSNIVWQQYGFSVTPPTLGWGIENWPTTAYGTQLGLPSGGSLNFPGSLAPSLPNFPYGNGLVPAGYIFDLVFHDDAAGNITGMTYTVTDLCGKTSSIGPVNIVGTSLAASGASGTIPASALAPMYGVQLNLVNQPGNAFEFSSGSGTITYSANEPLYVSNHQPSWTAAQGIVTGENSDIAYNELSSTPSKLIVQQFGLSQCECGGSSCELPSGSYAGSCTGCKVAPSGSGCALTCDSCGTLNGTPKANPSLQLPCVGSLTNGAVSNNNGDLQVQCTFVPNADAGVHTEIDAGCGPSACIAPDGPYLQKCTGCSAESSGMGCTLTCTSCTQTDGSEHESPNLVLPCTKPIENDNGVLACPDASSDAGSGGQGGSSGGQASGSGGQSGPSGGRFGSSGNAGSSLSNAGSSGAAPSGGGSSQAGSSNGSGSASSGCGCSLAALRTSPTQSFVALAIAGLLSFGRRRKRASV
jgi:hypothetical protein